MALEVLMTFCVSKHEEEGQPEVPPMLDLNPNFSTTQDLNKKFPDFNPEIIPDWILVYMIASPVVEIKEFR